MRQLGASMGKVLGYARVSTDAQDAASQKAVLKEKGAVVVFTETGNGSKLDGRDQLEAAIRLLERGDTLLAINLVTIERASWLMRRFRSLLVCTLRRLGRATWTAVTVQSAPARLTRLSLTALTHDTSLSWE